MHNLSCSDRTIELRFAHIPPSSSGEQKQAQRHFVHAVAHGLLHAKHRFFISMATQYPNHCQRMAVVSCNQQSYVLHIITGLQNEDEKKK